MSAEQAPVSGHARRRPLDDEGDGDALPALPMPAQPAPQQPLTEEDARRIAAEINEENSRRAWYALWMLVGALVLTVVVVSAAADVFSEVYEVAARQDEISRNNLYLFGVGVSAKALIACALVAFAGRLLAVTERLLVPLRYAGRPEVVRALSGRPEPRLVSVDQLVSAASTVLRKKDDEK
jgi:hypothetical protein